MRQGDEYNAVTATEIVGSPEGGLVFHRHVHASDSALGYAPIHRARSLNEWARDPLAR
jgi:hypothetical protein